MIFTAAMLSLPIIPILGSPVGWALLPFLLITLGALGFFIEKNYRDGSGLREILRLWPDLIAVERHDPDGRIRYWQANPFWVRTKLTEDGPVEKYLTLCGAGREIEIGAFLSPDERTALQKEIDTALAKASRSSSAT